MTDIVPNPKSKMQERRSAQPSAGGGKSAAELVRQSNRWRDNYNPIRGLFIARAIALLEAADRGDFAELQLVMRKVERRHPALKALKARRLAALEKLDWEIKIVDELPEGFDAAGNAIAATNGYPWGALYDAAGSATAVTNGWPWGALYDPAGAATAATNGLSLASGLAAFRGTNTFARTNAATASTLGLVKVDNSTITVSTDGTISATTGGSGTVTSVALSAPGEFSVSGSPVTGSGTLAITRTADANFLGFGATNLGFLKITNTAAISGHATISVLTVTNGFTNQSLTASTLLQADANKKCRPSPTPSAF